MKALLIKSLGSTERLPARFKVTIEGQKTFTISQESESFDYNSAECTQLQAVRHAFNYWDMGHIAELNDLNIGQLPNGDHVVTLSAKNDLYRAEILTNKGTETFYYLGNRIDALSAAQRKRIEIGGHDPLLTKVNHFIQGCEYRKV